MVTKKELTDIIITEYPDMKLRGMFDSSAADIYNDKIAIRFKPKSRYSLNSLRRVIKGERDKSFEGVIKLYGRTQLDTYNELPLFNKFINEELEERDLSRKYVGYFGDTIYKKIPVRDGNFDEKEFLGVVGSVIEAENLFDNVYKKSEKNTLGNYKTLKRQLKSSKFL